MRKEEGDPDKALLLCLQRGATPKGECLGENSLVAFE